MMKKILIVMLAILLWNPVGSSPVITRPPAENPVQQCSTCERTQTLDTVLGAKVLPAYFVADVRPEKPGVHGPDPGHQAGLRFGDFLTGFQEPSGDVRRIRDFVDATAFQYELDLAARRGVVWLEVYRPTKNGYFDNRPSKCLLNAAYLEARDKRIAEAVWSGKIAQPTATFVPIAGMYIQYLVTEVASDGPGAKSLSPGDVITRIGGNEVANFKNPIDADKLMNDAATSGKSLVMVVGSWTPISDQNKKNYPRFDRQFSYRPITISFSTE